jgi:hypothetical protein
MQEQPKHASPLALWQCRLRLDSYTVTTERVSIFQVADDFCRVGNSFVGVLMDHAARTAVIYHTRLLCEEDIVHELLHVCYPSWSEDEVNKRTDALLGRLAYTA